MGEPLPRRDDALERDLSALAGRVAFPPAPELVPSVTAAIAARRSLPIQSRQPWPRRHLFLTVAAALILLCLVATLVSPTARRAAADALGVAGIRIERIRPEPTALPSPAGATIGLGARTTLTVAAESAGFTLRQLDPTVYGAPDDVYLRPLTGDAALITFVYAPDARLPAAAETGTGVLLMQFVSRDDVELFMKGVMDGGTVQSVSFDGATGFWVEGTSQLTILNDPSVPPCCTTRPSANVLIWERDGVTYRMESALSLDEAIAVARSMTAVPGEPA